MSLPLNLCSGGFIRSQCCVVGSSGVRHIARCRIAEIRRETMERQERKNRI